MANSIRLNPIGTYATGTFDEGAAEITAFDPTSQRLFVVNANAATVDVLDISDPANPTQVTEIDATSFGGVANSVAVKNGIVAIAVENNNAQAPGQVVLLDTDGNFINAVEVRALPDMLTFTPDGQKILVANEGEPSSDYTVDPEGSVSIIDLANGAANASVTTADFTAFNDKIEELKNAGVRIFGPNASVAQDLEPEYIAVSPDSTTAWVTLQENNALAVVDIESGTVMDVLPLGFKDHNAAPSLETYFFDAEALPILGTTASRGDIRLSGFSGLYFEGVNPENGNLQFITHPDRGPDDGTDENGNRIFLLPDLQPQLVRFELDRATGNVSITERVFLTRADGTPLTGLPNVAGLDPDTPVDEDGNLLPFDPLGADLEGVVRAPDGSYWLADEYRPALYQFAADGTLLNRYVPEGLPSEVGTPAFPEVYNQRQPNRGFEAIAFQDGKVYAFVQSPFNNPNSDTTATTRILEFDPITETITGEYLYIQDEMGGGSDKIGDAVALDKRGEFLVIERDSGFGEDSVKNVYRINLDDATDLQALPDGILAAGETFESLTPEQLAERGINPVRKDLAADLAELGYGFTDKPEGLALVDSTTIAVLNDNDFGATGVPIGLGLVSFQNPLDASDEDGAINIRNWPVLGMYQPDAIATFESQGETYLITANEGDARDYDAFSEEARIEDLTLDPTIFPNAEILQRESELGRLTVTNTLGDTDGDGDFDQLYAFGGRSFSIWDKAGNLVYDSGADFERITAQLIPDNFNSDNTENNSFDSRSDAKGPEPEAVTTGIVNGRPYAFVGLERVGGIMVYDVSNPTSPSFVQYINPRDFTGDAEAGTAGDLGPEGFVFIAAEESPNGTPLLAVANEVSGTTTLYEILTPIYAVQGEGHTSPIVGETVTTTGIVTAVDANGFYLQDPNGDGNENTSDGIFVFTGFGNATVAVGDEVKVSGTVSEFIPGGASTGNLSITQISSDAFTVRSSGNALPDAAILGEGGRIPPNQIIDNDLETAYNVLAGEGDYDPAEDGIDFYETVEGMRVTINDAIAVSGTNRFGEIYTVADSGANATGLSDRGTLNIAPDDFNPERIQIQFDGDISGFTVDVNTGDFLGDVTGVVGYNFGNYEVVATEEFTPTSAGLEPEVSTLNGSNDQLTIASYNVLNLDPKVEDVALVDDNDPGEIDDDVANGRFEAIARQIVNNLNAPDIVALQEVQDSNGAEITNDVSAEETLQRLIDEIAALSGITYQFIDNPFIGNETSGGQPGGNIRNAYLYNPERVSFVENSLQTVTDPAEQQTNPDNPFFDTRLPLVAKFTFNGKEITVVNNHFSSKGGSSPLFGQTQPATELQEDPSVNGSLDQRRAQAQAVKDFVDGVLADDPTANVVVLGDLNEFEFISPLEILEENLTNLTETLPETERYSFIFDGNSQSLDHILVSNNLASGAEFDIVHVNTEFASTPGTASDHDPLLARLSFSNRITLRGNELDNQILGADGDQIIEALDGNDLVAGGLGNDLIFGGTGDDVLRGDLNSRAPGGSLGGDDVIYGGDGSDRLGGKAGNDELYGESGDDLMWGDDGDDLLRGGLGNDRLVGDDFSGGRGSDTFVLAAGEGTDTIVDFTIGTDRIGLAGGLSLGQLSLTQSGRDALIEFNDETLAILNNVKVSLLTETAFTVI